MVRASVNGFHHPAAHRHALGRTAEAFWSRSFDYVAFRSVLVGGILLQRKELRDAWDLVVFLDVPFEVSIARSDLSRPRLG